MVKYFWTSKSDLSKVFVFYSYEGSILYESNGRARVMCVRGKELPSGTFATVKVNGDDIVRDSASGLIWQKSYVENKDWKHALSYCENLEYAGYSDWRLPNQNELASILNYDKEEAPYSDFPDIPDSNVPWLSSSGDTGGPVRIYFAPTIDIDNSYYYPVSGLWYYENKFSNVRCVRSE